MTIKDLKAMLESQTFHHATYRNQGTLHEGLWIYVRKETGFRGYDVAGCFPKDSPELESAFELVRGTGISVGAYGRG
jgi:hypothetical protein